MAQSIIFRSLAGSNMPRSHKNVVARMLDSVKSETRKAMNPSGYHFGKAFGEGVESVALGAVLGGFHASEGLDIKGKVPSDFLLGILGLATSRSDFMRTAGNTGFAAFGFRQGYAFMAEKKRQSGGSPVGFSKITDQLKGSSVHGEFEAYEDFGADDPIKALAKEF